MNEVTLFESKSAMSSFREALFQFHNAPSRKKKKQKSFYALNSIYFPCHLHVCLFQFVQLQITEKSF